MATPANALPSQSDPANTVQSQGGFFSRLGAGLKQVMPYVTPIANRLAAAVGNYGPLELEHQQKELELQQAHEQTQKALADSQMQNQELNRQLLQKQIANVRSPEETEALKPPTDIVAPMPEGGYGHYNRAFNPQTKQFETTPTMVNQQVPNPAVGAQAATAATITGLNAAPTLPGGQQGPTEAPAQQAPPPLMPPVPETITQQRQLPAVQKPLSQNGDVEPDASSPTGFSKVWRGPGFQELFRTPAPAPSAYVGSTTSGETTVLKDTPEGQVPVELPHSTTRTPIPPGGGVPPVPPTKPPIPGAGGPKVGTPLLPSSKENKWVTWQTPDGRQVAGSAKEALTSGAQNPTELSATEGRDILNARQAVRLMTKQGDPNKPETQGVLQLIDSLDKDGKLGIVASRWNSYMTTGVGSAPGDDPRIITLIDKNMLGQTATMLAHFGASGGRSPQMLQHFLDLANSRKMDGPTLKAGILAEADYMNDRAMLPGGSSPYGPPQGAQGGTFSQWKASQGKQ